MMTAILSLSLLTVMAGAAVAPALGTIREHFSDSPDTVVQLIISMPALFIFLTSFIFPYLCKKYGSRTLVMTGLALYVIGGCGAALFDNILDSPDLQGTGGGRRRLHNAAFDGLALILLSA